MAKKAQVKAAAPKARQAVTAAPVAAAPAQTAGQVRSAGTIATNRESDVRDQTDELHGTRRDDSGRLLYWARRPFGYGGDDLDRGQVVALTGAINDAKLSRLGYVVPLLPTDTLFPCRHCRARFVDLSTLNAHGDKRHKDIDRRPTLPTSARGLTVDDTAVDTESMEREQDNLDRIAPLNIDKTAASRT